MIALEVSSAAGRPPYGGIGGSIRNQVERLVRSDPRTRYVLGHRFSRWRKGRLFRVDAPNARVRVLQDPWNGLLLRGARLVHGMSAWLPRTPPVPKLVTVYDLSAVVNPQWCTPHWHEVRTRRIATAVSRADHVVAPSDFTRGELCEVFRIDPERVHVVPCGVDAEIFRPPPSGTVERLRARHGDYVLCVGLLTGRKNVVSLVRAMAALPELRLLLVGRGSEAEAEVEAEIDRAGMRERTTRLVGVSQQELIGLLGAARALAVASLYEGFGLTVLEGMACGTPVVCSKAASLPEVAGDAALLVDAAEPEALAEGLRRATEDPALAEDLRKRGLERARGLSWEHSAERLHALYRELGAV